MTSNPTRTPSTARLSPAPLRYEPGEVIHVGVDVHKATYHVAVLSDRRGLLATWVQPARPELLAERLGADPGADRRPRLRGGADRLRPGPPPPRRGLARPGHRHLEGPRPGRPGGQVRPARLPPAGPARLQGAAAPGAGPHRAGGGRPPGAPAPRAAGPQVRARSSSRSRRSSCSTASPSRTAWPTGRSGPSRHCAGWSCCRSCGSAWT